MNSYKPIRNCTLSFNNGPQPRLKKPISHFRIYDLPLSPTTQIPVSSHIHRLLQRSMSQPFLQTLEGHYPHMERTSVQDKSKIDSPIKCVRQASPAKPTKFFGELTNHDLTTKCKLPLLLLKKKMHTEPKTVEAKKPVMKPRIFGTSVNKSVTLFSFKSPMNSCMMPLDFTHEELSSRPFMKYNNEKEYHRLDNIHKTSTTHLYSPKFIAKLAQII